MHVVDTVTLTAIMHTNPHSTGIHLINPQDLGNKTVNLLLRASVARQGWLHIMQDERRDMGWLYHSNWPHGAQCSLPARLPSYSMPVEHWFSTLLAHMIPPFLRGKLPGWRKKKKDSLWSIGPLRYWIQVTSWGRWGEREGVWGWRRCTAGGGTCKTGTEEE